MGSDVVVVVPPLFKDHLCFPQRMERLPIEAFIAQTTVKALVIAILPRTAWLDIQGLDAKPGKP